MRNILFAVFLVTYTIALSAQEVGYKFIDGNSLSTSGRSTGVNNMYFQRIDSSDFEGLPKSVQYLSTNSAGINITFKTNANTIKVKWSLSEYKVLTNMTPLAVNGLDLYGWNGKEWQYIASARTSEKEKSATFIENLDGKMRHYKVYLPLYTGLDSIEIGINANAVIQAADSKFLPNKKVVIYGSSITQGASASRPGLAYPSIIARDLDLETFNMGFSGSGKMEIELADILAGMDADLYVLDCVPNPSPEELEERAVPFIKRLRKLKPDVPILMVESIIMEHGKWNPEIGERVRRKNEHFHYAYNLLIREGYNHLYYIPAEELIQTPHGYTVDGVHLNDLGFSELAERVGKSVAAILKQKL